MGSLPDGHHHRSTTKVSHKPFKSRHSTKGVIKELTKGKIERHEKGSRKTPHQQVMSKIDRRNQAKQLRQVKHRENAKAASVFTGPSGAPRIVAVVPLCEDCDANAAIRKLNQSVDSDIEMPGEGPWKVRIDRFGQSILYIPLKRELIPAVNACRVADFVVFLLSPGQEAGEEGEQLIRAIESQGISNVLAMVQDLDSVHPAKKQPQIIGSLKSYITHFFPTLEKVHSLDSGRECANVIRSLCTTTPKGIVWREDRSWMFVEDVQWSETLNESHEHAGASLTGVVRGKGMKANRLIQVGDWGYFQIEKITDASLPTSKKRKAEEMTVDTEDAAIKILETPDEDQDDLDELAPYDETMHDVGEAPMSEAPSERKGVLLDDHHYYSDEDGSMPPQPKKLPKGTSTYQSAWFLGDMSDTYSSDDENHIDEEGDLSMEPPPLVQDEPMTTTQPEPTEATPSDYPQSEAFNDPSLLDEANELEAYRTSRKVSAAEDREYPDEIELHPNVLARERLSRYRGLRSLKTSPWDTTEDKPHEPQDYGRLLRIPDYRSARKHAANEALVGGIAPGRRVTIHLRNVPLSLRHQHQAPSSPYNPLTAFSLLRHEHKRTVINTTITLPSTSPSPIASKSPLLIQIGARRFLARPLFSELSNTPNNVHKYLRFLHPGQTAVASFIAPLTWSSSTPCLYFLLPPQPKDPPHHHQQPEGTPHPHPPSLSLPSPSPSPSPPSLLATGTLLPPSPARVLAKRIVLTGAPFRVHRKRVTVRYMFFHKADVEWFRALRLWTKRGRQGFVRESLGTHGYFKAVFDGPVGMQESVAVSLFKRVWPRGAVAWRGGEEDQGGEGVEAEEEVVMGDAAVA